MHVRRIDAEDWRSWRLIRLQALSEAPDAFGVRLSDVDDREVIWRGRIDAAEACFVAVLDAAVVGMVAADPSRKGIQLQSMFVAAESRGTGVGRALVHAVVQHSAGRPLRLAVVEGNSIARSAYERCGFQHDGRCADSEGCVTMLHDPQAKEHTDAR